MDDRRRIRRPRSRPPLAVLLSGCPLAGGTASAPQATSPRRARSRHGPARDGRALAACGCGSRSSRRPGRGAARRAGAARDSGRRRAVAPARSGAGAGIARRHERAREPRRSAACAGAARRSSAGQRPRRAHDRAAGGRVIEARPDQEHPGRRGPAPAALARWRGVTEVVAIEPRPASRASPPGSGCHRRCGAPRSGPRASPAVRRERRQPGRPGDRGRQDPAGSPGLRGDRLPDAGRPGPTSTTTTARRSRASPSAAAQPAAPSASPRTPSARGSRPAWTACSTPLPSRQRLVVVTRDHADAEHGGDVLPGAADPAEVINNSGGRPTTDDDDSALQTSTSHVDLRLHGCLPAGNTGPRSRSHSSASPRTAVHRRIHHWGTEDPADDG